MKKLIASAGIILVSGFFFAGFWSGDVFAQQDPPPSTSEDNDPTTKEEIKKRKLEMQKAITINQCYSMLKKVTLFKALKARNDFDYTKLGNSTDAYKSELNGYFHLETALSCMDENIYKDKERECFKKFSEEKINGKQGLISKDKECPQKDLNDLEKLEFISSELSRAALALDRAKEEYFEGRHLKLDEGFVYDKNGKLKEGEGLDEIMTDNIITRAGGGFISSTQDSLRNIFRGNLVKKVNRALGTVAVLYLFILGVKFIMARGDSERLSELKGQFAWIILGLGVISVAEFMGYEVFDSSKDILEGTAARNFEAKLTDVVRFVEYIAGGLMLINALISGYTLIIGGEEDETISREKQFLKSFLMGTAFILMAEVIVRAISFRNEDNIHESSRIIVQEVAGLVNFSLSFIGIVATAMLVLAGLYYVISFGDDDQMGRAKKMIMASIAGIIISFSAYTIVRFLIT